MSRLAELREKAQRCIDSASLEELDNLKVTLLGKKSEVKGLLRGLGELPADQRPLFGAEVNAVAREIEERIAARREELSVSAGAASSAGFDFTRPGFRRRAGLPHPLITTMDRITDIFVRLGYGIAEGPDVEDDAHNFTDLNFPEDHPARDAQDTFFLAPGGGTQGMGSSRFPQPQPRDGGPLLLRTHTSPVQIRVMAKTLPPLAVIVPGRTYRADAQDATHSPIFHQVEGLVVGENITMAHLKGTLDHFTREFFGPGFEIRFRPSFFPFTEPSAEVDVSCVACGRREAGSGTVPPPGVPGNAHIDEIESRSCRVCHGSGWLEILGAGMVDPEVFEAVSRRRGDRVYDPERVTGFAFGMGVERITMLRHGVDDLRLFYENDPRFLAMLATLS